MELVLQAYSLENVMRQKLFYETSFSKINEIVKIKITNLHDYFFKLSMLLVLPNRKMMYSK